MSSSGEMPSGSFSGGGACRLDQRGLGQPGLKFRHGCLVLEPLPLPLVLDLLELAAELVPLIQGLGQLRVQGFGMIGGGGALHQFLPGGSKPEILGLKGLDHVGVGTGVLGDSAVIGPGASGEAATWSSAAWSRAISS